MDLFGMGIGELLILLVVALIVFGPEKMVDAARSLGRFSRRISQAGKEFTQQLENEIDLADKPGKGLKAPEDRNDNKSGTQQLKQPDQEQPR